MRRAYEEFGTLCAIARTSTLMTFGMHHGYFQSEPFGPARMRRDVVRAAKQSAISRGGDNATGITIDLCPNGDEMYEYADAFKLVYPAMGAGWYCSGSTAERASWSSLRCEPTISTRTS